MTALSREAEAAALAEALLNRFGDLGRVLCAPRPALTQVPGMSEAAADSIGTLHTAAMALLRAKAKTGPVIGSWDALVDYAHACCAHRETEAFHVLWLDRKNRLICDDQMGQGTVDHCPVYPREIARRALEVNATACILVHNHPSGDPTPSEADISMTARVRDALEVLGIVLHDHLVVGHGRDASLRASGHL